MASDNKLEKGENFRVEGSLDSDAVSKNPPTDLSIESKENQRDLTPDTPFGINDNDTPDTLEEEAKRTSTECGNGVSVSNP